MALCRRVCRRLAANAAAIALVVSIAALGPNSTAAEPGAQIRHQVLVYYANETTERAAGSKNYTALLSLLRGSGSEIAGRIADSILNDATAFPAAVRLDIEALFGAARRWGVDVFVFTNEMAFGGRYSIYRHATGTTETRRLPDLPPAESPILETSPLSRTDYFRAALLAVAGLYPPNSLDIVLITNSHGAGDLALTPRVFADISLANADDLLAALEGAPLAGDGPPRWAAVRGTDKRDYWSALVAAGSRFGVRFPLVFREACASGVSSWAEYLAVPDNVGLIAHSGYANIRYNDIDYGEIFSAAGTVPAGTTLNDFLTAALRDRGIHVEAPSAMWDGVLRDEAAAYFWLFFVPLALWILWYFGATLRSARRP